MWCHIEQNDSGVKQISVEIMIERNTLLFTKFSMQLNNSENKKINDN